MKLIKRYTDYAVRCLCVMAGEPDKIFSVRKLMRSTAVPRPFLRKIFQILGRKKIIKSFRGRGGGFSLNMKPSEINMLLLIEALQGKFTLMEHKLRGQKCPDQCGCRLKMQIDKIEKRLLSDLSGLTIHYIADKEDS